MAVLGSRDQTVDALTDRCYYYYYRNCRLVCVDSLKKGDPLCELSQFVANLQTSLVGKFSLNSNGNYVRENKSIKIILTSDHILPHTPTSMLRGTDREKPKYSFSLYIALLECPGLPGDYQRH